MAPESIGFQCPYRTWQEGSLQIVEAAEQRGQSSPRRSDSDGLDRPTGPNTRISPKKQAPQLIYPQIMVRGMLPMP